MTDLGTFIYTDTGSDIVLTIADHDGDPFNLAGSTGIVLECRSTSGETVEIAGALQDPAEGEIVFADLGTCVTPTNDRPRIALEGIVKWTQGGELNWSRDSVRFTVALFP